MNLRIMLGVLLLTCIILISLPFERGYHTVLAGLAHHTGVRFIAGIVLIGMASYDIVLAAMIFMILFLWIADIQLLSSVQFGGQKASGK